MSLSEDGCRHSRRYPEGQEVLRIPPQQTMKIWQSPNGQASMCKPTIITTIQKAAVTSDYTGDPVTMLDKHLCSCIAFKLLLLLCWIDSKIKVGFIAISKPAFENMKIEMHFQNPPPNLVDILSFNIVSIFDSIQFIFPSGHLVTCHDFLKFI